MKKLTTLAAVALLGACTQIDTGNVGVESTFGQVKKEIMPPDFYFTLFKRVTEVNGNEMRLSLDDLKPQTQDKIFLDDLDVDFYIQIASAKAPEIMIRWPGDLYQAEKEEGVRLGMNYVTRQAREAVYTAATKFGAATINNDRAALVGQMVKLLQDDLDSSAGKGWFFVRSANIRQLTTDKTLDANIKAAAAAQFEIQKKQNDIKVAEAEAQRKRVEAQGDADAIKLRAAAISAQGGAEYVQLQAIQKWNGVLPQTSAGGVLPFINVGK